jgi:hypothetical protein
MKTSVLIILTVTVLIVGSALAVMNNACKSAQHAWCAPMSTIPHHLKPFRGAWLWVSGSYLVFG